MTQRALVQRYTAGAGGGTDVDTGATEPGTWATHVAALPCWLYGSSEREAVGEDTTAVVTDLKMMVPLSATVTEQDRIASVVDRRGTVIEPVLLHVDEVLRKRSHLQLSLSSVAA